MSDDPHIEIRGPKQWSERIYELLAARLRTDELPEECSVIIIAADGHVIRVTK